MRERNREGILLSLRFILGVAGSGKTEYCLNEIRQQLGNDPDGSSLILLVPEQATFQLEKELALTKNIDGLMRVQVLSFRRLAWRVFRDEGGLSRSHIGELGKKMVLKKILENRKEELGAFAQASRQPGFLDMLSRNLSEMKRYLLTPEQLSASANFFEDSVHRLLSAKLRDISLIYKDFENYLSSKYLDPDDYLSLLAEKLPHCDFIKGSSIWIDDFTGFTPQEYKVLEQLMKVAEQVSISLCLDPNNLQKPLEDEDRFYITRETYEKLSDLCTKVNISVDEPVLLSNSSIPYRFVNSPELAFLEKNYFSFETSVFKNELKKLKLAAAVNRRAEVEGAAREIISLVRDKGYRWREIAVILRDFENYQEIIEAVFSNFDIPVFIDKKRLVSHHPLIELIISSIEVVSENFSYEPLFRILKTDFFPLTRDEIDRLENYVIAHGIRGNAWLKEEKWYYRRQTTLGEDNEIAYWEKRELELVNEAKSKIQTILVEFYHKLKNSTTVKDKTIVVFSLLEQLKVDITLKRWIEKANKTGKLEEASEHSQVYDGIIQVFEEIVEALGSEHISLSEYLQIMKTGLESIQLGLIPPGLDQVMVVSLGRSRTPNVKAAFLLGVSDGVLPKRPIEDGMLTDKEREQLKKVGIEVAPGEERLLIDEDFLIYTGLTRASHYLCITYPLADEEGRAIMHSMIIDRLKAMYPKLEADFWTLEPANLEETAGFLTTANASFPILINQLRLLKEGCEIGPLWLETYNWFLANDELKDKLSLLQSIFWKNQEAPLSKNIAANIFPKTLRTSVSRLEKYNSCPFSHYLTYGLKLKKRVTHKLEAPDYGQFYHASLKDVVANLKEEGIDLADVSENKLKETVEQVVDQLAPQLQNEILISSNRYKYLTKKLKDTVIRSVKIMQNHAGRSYFRPVGLEMPFGPEEGLSTIEIAINEESKVQLAGRIDRVDLAVHGDEAYITIIDYKSGNASLDLEDVYHGLSLQLLAYLIVCLENPAYFGCQELIPGGILYFKVHNPMLIMNDLWDDEKLHQEILKKYKMRGLVLGNEKLVGLMDKDLKKGRSPIIPVGITEGGEFYADSSIFTKDWFAALKCHFTETVRKIARDIVEGKVAIEPYKKGQYKPCNYCDYKAVCHFDNLFTENNYRILEKISKRDFWQKLLAAYPQDRRL